MADENKKFPNGWGSDEDDDDYDFIGDTDEDDEDSAWGNGSPFKKKESVTDSNENEESDNGQTEASVPAQEVKTFENSAAPVSPVNPPYNQGYVIQKQKSNPLFIIVIIILVLIIGVLCTAIFMVNKNKKTNGSEKSGNSSYDEALDVNVTKNSESKSNDDVVNKMIKQEVLNNIAKSFYTSANSALIEMDEEGYDINGYFIIASDKKYNYNVPTANFDEDVFYTKLNYHNDGDNSGFAWFVVVNDQTCVYAAASNSWENEKNTGYYNGVGTRVIRSQCEPKDLDDNNIKVLCEHLKSMESTITTPYIEPEENSESLEFDTQSKSEKNGFTFFDSVSTVKHELTIYELLNETDEISISGEQQHLIYYKYPSPDNINIILGLCFVEDSLIGVNFGFESIMYSNSDIFKNIKNNITGKYGQPNHSDDTTVDWYADPFGPDTYFWLYDYGNGVQLSYFVNYEASEIDKLLPIDISTVPLTLSSTPVKVDVYSCNYLGVINTRGLGVTGFATSYVVDGGEAKEVRHRVGDWHVKAVRYCNSKGVLWYELYDAEDGDYYGWVDAEYIDFSPSDTSEYTDKSDLIATGKVITESDDLNMRESDSATSKIITTIPKGHYVGIISEYGDWLYVKYYADTNSPIYYGFVSKQFIEITERYGNG